MIAPSGAMTRINSGQPGAAGPNASRSAINAVASREAYGRRLRSRHVVAVANPYTPQDAMCRRAVSRDESLTASP